MYLMENTFLNYVIEQNQLNKFKKKTYKNIY